MEKLRLGLFIDTWYPMVDGVVVAVDNYARKLSCDYDVTVFCPAHREKHKREFPYKVVQCKSLKLFFLDYDLPIPKLDGKFKNALSKSNLDIVHIHSPFGVAKMGIMYAKKHDIPVVATLHSQFEQDFSRATNGNKELTRNLLSKVIKVFNECDEYYAVNAKIAEIFKRYGTHHLPSVQRNGTDFLPILDEQKALDFVNGKYNLLPSMPVFLFVGRINKLKNIYFIADALSHLKTTYYKMIFVGDGQDKPMFEKHIDALGLKDKVIFTGKIFDRYEICALYLRAKLFLFPSMYDASSLVQIEAASQKTPTLFLKDSATSATVTDNVNGYICENSTEAFAQKIEDILLDTDGYNKVSLGAFNDLYVTWDDCAKELSEKYHTEIEKKNKSLE